MLLSGSANPQLGAAIAREMALPVGRTILERFPDRELRVELLEEVRGRDVFVVQSLGPPAEHPLLELLLLGDAARRGGARRVTAVVPYLAYARQDRRATGREPLAGRLVADLLQCAGFQAIVALDVHSPAVEGFFGIPLEHLSAIPLLAEALRDGLAEPSVVVSPDLGGARRAEACAELLRLPVAVVHKSRVTGSDVAVRGVTGNVRGCAPIIVDDMISTGGTIEAAVGALVEAGCTAEVTVAATHALLVGDAVERLARLPIRRLVTTDSVQAAGDPPRGLLRVGVAPLIAAALRRLAHHG